MTDYNASRRFIKARLPRLVGRLPHRSTTICGVMLHCTRAGRTAGDDGPGTENWMNHPDNGGAAYDMLVFESGQQVQATRWEEDEQPLWCAGFGNAGTWSAQQFYLQLELGQGTVDDPFTPEELESAAQWVAQLAKAYGFPIQRIENLTQAGEPPQGICDHANSANGRRLGKSDVGHMFPWDAFIARARALARGEDEPMTPEERTEFNELKTEVKTLRRIVGGFPANDFDLLVNINELNGVLTKHFDDHKKEKEFTR